MTTEIEMYGERHAVAARRDGERWVVTVNGREVTVDVAEVAGRWSMLIGSSSYEVSVAPGVVVVNGRAFPVTVADPRAAFGRRADAAHRGGEITAPMPGRVVRVLVGRGDTVAARQPLVIVEAMKMENELRAPRAGTVADVRVVEGASVEAHAVLIVIE